MCFHTLRITSVDRPEKVGCWGASLLPPVRQAALSQCETFTDTMQLNASSMQLTKAEQKEAADSARRLFQNHRLPDKTSRDILLDIWKVSKNCYMFIARFLAEPRLGNAGLHSPFV